MQLDEFIQKLEGLHLDPILLDSLVSRLRAEGLTEELRQQVAALLRDELEVTQAERDFLIELEDVAQDTQANVEDVEATADDQLNKIEQETAADIDAAAGQPVPTQAPSVPPVAPAPPAPGEPTSSMSSAA